MAKKMTARLNNSTVANNIADHLMIDFLKNLIYGKPVVDERLDSAKDRRKKMNGLLMSWGEWSDRGSSKLGFGKSLGKFVCDDGSVGGDVDGFDHYGLSDHDSLMILIDNLVRKLNRVDLDLLKFEYISIEKNRMHLWADRYQKSPGRYKNRKSELLLDLSYKLRVKLG